MVELRVRIGSKGQIVIPKIFRQAYKFYPEQEVIIQNEKEGVLIKIQEEDVVEKLKAIAVRAAKQRKGKKFSYDKREFYEQYSYSKGR